MVLETLFIIIINITIFVFILKIIQMKVSTLAKTSKDKFHNIYQGGELLQAKDRRYQSNLFILILIFLILHIFVFLIATLTFINIIDVYPAVFVFLLAFIYVIALIRKGVNYS